MTSVACNHSRIVFEDAEDGLQDVRVQHAVVLEEPVDGVYLADGSVL